MCGHIFVDNLDFHSWKFHKRICDCQKSLFHNSLISNSHIAQTIITITLVCSCIELNNTCHLTWNNQYTWNDKITEIYFFNVQGAYGPMALRRRNSLDVMRAINSKRWYVLTPHEGGIRSECSQITKKWILIKFVAITALESRREWNEISIEFELRWKNR